MAAVKASYAKLSCMRVCIMYRGTMDISEFPLAWLARHTLLRTLTIKTQSGRGYSGKMDAEKLAQHLPAVRALTRLELRGVHLENFRGDVALRSLLQALAALPCLEEMVVEAAVSGGVAARSQQGTDAEVRCVRVYA